jgi:hypothetical protein
LKNQFKHVVSIHLIDWHIYFYSFLQPYHGFPLENTFLFSRHKAWLRSTLSMDPGISCNCDQCLSVDWPQGWSCNPVMNYEEWFPEILLVMTQFKLGFLLFSTNINPDRYIDDWDEFSACVCAYVSSIFLAK